MAPLERFSEQLWILVACELAACYSILITAARYTNARRLYGLCIASIPYHFCFLIFWWAVAASEIFFVSIVPSLNNLSGTASIDGLGSGNEGGCGGGEAWYTQSKLDGIFARPQHELYDRPYVSSGWKKALLSPTVVQERFRIYAGWL